MITISKVHCSTKDIVWEVWTKLQKQHEEQQMHSFNITLGTSIVHKILNLFKRCIKCFVMVQE